MASDTDRPEAGDTDGIAASEASSGRELEFEILAQPDDSTCGPTCLHAVYRYYGDDLDPEEIRRAIPALATGGTLAVLLANHALRRGYRVTIYTYNLNLFDPTWFGDPPVDLAERLAAQAAVKPDERLQAATPAYLKFLALGGRLRLEELTATLIRSHLDRRCPILTGLSATYLYGCAREVGEHDLAYDDVRGVPTGHFVVLHGYDRRRREVLIADPAQDNPRFGVHHYRVGIERVLGAILLGVVTYDANLLLIEPAGAASRP